MVDTTHNGGPQPVGDMVWIEPTYRSDADPAKGIRRPFGFAREFAWHHDGADDDIVAYRVTKGPDHG